MRLALYQPDIPQNTGAMMRLAACLGVPLDIIEPCGFALDDRKLRRVGMDYLDHLTLIRHESWEAFLRDRDGRLLLLTTAAQRSYASFAFESQDILLVGRESAGAPQEVHEAADARLRVPMRAGTRSLNVSLAAAMVLGEALRQTNQIPGGIA